MITTQKLPQSKRYDIPYRVTSHEQNCHVDFNCAHTPHSYQRSKQRGISNEAIALTLEFGDCICKQNLEFYFLGEKQVPKYLKNERSKFANTVVVMREGKYVLTCYRNQHSSKKIRIKSKTLF